MANDPSPTPKLNAVGDVILDDPRAMRALADPARLALHDALRRHGTATVGELAALLGADRQEIEAALEALEEVGLVERSRSATSDEQVSWAAVGRGVFFEIPEDAEGEKAARELSNAMLLQYADLPRRWVTEDEPQLPVEWVRAAGLFNARLLISADELRHVQQGLENLLERYLTRRPDAAPPDVAHVRVLSYFMPEPQRPKRS